MTSSSFVLRILQPVIPHYRVKLFEGVARRYPGCVELWAQREFEHCQSIVITKAQCDYSHPSRRFGPFIWQKGLSIRGMKSGEDVLVLCGEPRNLAMMLVALKAKFRRIPIVWWGHHMSATSKMWRARIRFFMMHIIRPDAILVYTNAGVEWMKRMGFSRYRLFATGNTIDQEPIKKELAYWSKDKVDAFVAQHKLVDKKILLLCSVLRPKVRICQAVRAVASEALTSRNVILVVIGDGPERAAAQALAEELKVADRILWVGALYEQHEMAPWFLAAQAFVYPGSIGLSILHSMSYGLPVVVHGNMEHQMPEFEVMEAGVTGLTFRENDVDDFVAKITEVLDDELKRSEMSRRSRELAFEKYSMDNMVGNFCKAIEAARQCAFRNASK